jgi:hypothetical protein
MFAVVLAVAGLTIGPASSGGAQAPGTAPPPKAKAAPVDLSKYPDAVRATIEAETKNATVKHVSKETEKGKTQYEVETMANGKSRDLLVDASGKVIEVEEEIALDAAPAPVQSALARYAKVLKLERVTREGAITYEASVQDRHGKKSSVALDGR